MKKQKLLIFLLIMTHLSGCLGFVYNRKIVDKYWLIETDSKADMSLSYELGNENFIGIIHGGVYALGYNFDYIIVKQHPYIPFPDSINKLITNYYIIPIDRSISKYKVQENLIGPLNEIEFVKQKEKLKIPLDLEFQIVIEENE
ncbi:MAG: hypothetical protein Q8R96_18080 [Bacteroidota bacterium]|nr:hypothetical protein [Bacteroidota bacterium]